jgi:hypothetical protein
VKLDLVDCRWYIRILQSLLQVSDGVIAYAHRSALSLFQKSGHTLPGFISRFLGPMDQVQIQIGKTKSSKALFTRLDSGTVPMISVPQLCCHEDFFPRDPALAYSDRNVCLVSVDFRGVDLAGSQSPAHT